MMNQCAARTLRTFRQSIVLTIGLSTFAVSGPLFGQPAVAPATGTVEKSVISLDPAAGPNASEVRAASNRPAIPVPADFHNFEDARVGETADVETLTLRFAATTRLNKISSTPDFTIEGGGTCIEGDVYDAKQTCTLLVRFTPRGAGHRLGHIIISNSASVAPAAFGLTGYGYTPVLSFIPAQISTIPASYPSSKGLLSGALNLSIDGGDTLYVADTGNNVIRSMDSSGTFLTISNGGLSAPEGVVADTFGEVYFTEPAQDALYEIYAYGPQFVESGSTLTATCSISAPCPLSGQKLFTPGEMATDGYGRIFFVDAYYGAAEFVSQSTSASYARLEDPFTYQAATPGVLAVDTSDNLYSFWYNGGVCSISLQTFSNAANYYPIYQKVAGGKTCGFAGDGGQARNAEISNNIGQMAFDAAGDLYFTDTGNQRVRRIDYTTGIIHTIAGNGTRGYAGDGGQADQAHLGNPSGIGVDSLGQVYVISGASNTLPNQIIRKIGADGMLNFGNQTDNTASTAHIVTLTNSGNAALTFTKAQIIGGSASQFTIDPATTTCILTAGAQLASGQTCYVGVIFKPTSAVTHTGTLQFLDNTVPGTNSVHLTGVGTATAATKVVVTPLVTQAAMCHVPTFIVRASGSDDVTPSGTVQLKVGGKVTATTSLVNGSAILSVTGLTAGTHNISASYEGDAVHAAATSAPVSETIASGSCAKPIVGSGSTVAVNANR
jgi:hypothetical protein